MPDTVGTVFDVGKSLFSGIFGGPDKGNLPASPDYGPQIDGDPVKITRYRQYRTLGLSDSDSYLLTVSDFWTGDKYANQRAARSKAVALAAGKTPPTATPGGTGVVGFVDKAKDAVIGIIDKLTDKGAAQAGNTAGDKILGGITPFLLIGVGLLVFLAFRKGR